MGLLFANTVCGGENTFYSGTRAASSRIDFVAAPFGCMGFWSCALSQGPHACWAFPPACEEHQDY
eukprot:220138-Lingulodinium_polyedra.AAC.1